MIIQILRHFNPRSDQGYNGNLTTANYANTPKASLYDNTWPTYSKAGVRLFLAREDGSGKAPSLCPCGGATPIQEEFLKFNSYAVAWSVWKP